MSSGSIQSASPDRPIGSIAVRTGNDRESAIASLTTKPRGLRYERDNVLDAKARGRGRNFSAKGAENPRAKLSDQDVAEIRRRIAAGDGDRAIAADFPVTAAMIWRIRRGKSWT